MENDFDIALLKAGNVQEFLKVYNYFEPRLNGYFYMKVSNTCLNADVIQQTFIKLWINRERLNPDVKLSTQVFQIAKTTMIDELRKEQTVTRKKQFALQRAGEAKANEKVYHLEGKELHYRLNKVIDSLPAVRKTVFLLSREDDLTHKEISHRLSISVKTVNKHIQLALKQIRPYFTAIQLVAWFIILHQR